MRFRIAAAAFLLAAFLGGCASPESPSAGSRVVSFAAADAPLLSKAIFLASNRARAAQGLPALHSLRALDAAADQQAVHMALMLYPEHGNPIANERSPSERVHGKGVRWRRIGENVEMQPVAGTGLAATPPYTYDSLADFLVAEWMASPPHRENLLDPGFTRLGCAARFAHGVHGDMLVFAVEDFVESDPMDPFD